MSEDTETLIEKGSISAKKKIAKLLSEYFEGDAYEALMWLMLRNRMCGSQAPSVLLAIGREKQLLALIEKHGCSNTND